MIIFPSLPDGLSYKLIPWSTPEMHGVDHEVIADKSGKVVHAATNRPNGATILTEAAWDALDAQRKATWEQDAIAGQAFVDDLVADAALIRQSARAKLVAGQPMTEAEADSLVGF